MIQETINQKENTTMKTQGTFVGAPALSAGRLSHKVHLVLALAWG